MAHDAVAAALLPAPQAKTKIALHESGDFLVHAKAATAVLCALAHILDCISDILHGTAAS